MAISDAQRALVKRWTSGATVRELARDLELPEVVVGDELRRALRGLPTEVPEALASASGSAPK